jgi:SAM-dependent methyltransferase
MIDNFYSQFEQSFRGQRADIKERLKVYAPFVDPLVELYPDALALDLGCGRGEWLEILSDKGFVMLGVDLDDGMLKDCRALNLNVKTQDAVSALQALDDHSVSIVSAFHLVEHIPFEVLRTLVLESHRVLKPGGVLIMETPNPENIKVGTSSFYLDPTHSRPIPPGLLSFLTKYCGFLHTKVLRLQESPVLRQNLSPSLNDVLGGASPDYAVIAQKDGDQVVLDSLKSAFALDLGLTIETLADRHEKRLKAAEQAIATLNDVYNSSSWKVTRPLRAFGIGLHQIKQFFKRRP